MHGVIVSLKQLFSVCVCLSVSACEHVYVSASVHKGLKRTSGSLGSWEPPDTGAGKPDLGPLSKPNLPSWSLHFQWLCMGLPASLHLWQHLILSQFYSCPYAWWTKVACNFYLLITREGRNIPPYISQSFVFSLFNSAPFLFYSP